MENLLNNAELYAAESEYIQIYDGQLLPDEPIVKGQIGNPGPEYMRIFQQHYEPVLKQSGLPLDQLRVLEIGAGFGRLTHTFMQVLQPEFYLATEPFVSLCKVLRENMDEWGYEKPKGIVGVYDANYPSQLEPGTVNLVLGNSVLHHILDYRGCLTHLTNVLDAPGMMLFVEPIQEAWSYWVSVVKSALALNRRDGSALKLSSRSQNILTRHVDNLEARMYRKHDREYLKGLDDKHIFSIPELMQVAADNRLRFYAHKTTRQWISLAAFRLKQLSIAEGDRERLRSYFEEILPLGMSDTVMDDFAMTICFQKDA